MKIFRKAKSRFYWFDFTVRGQRYRGSTGETKAVNATKVASTKLARALEHGLFLPTKPTALGDLSERFLAWLEEAAQERLLGASTRCNWRPRTRDLFRDIVIVMRDTGMRNERELFRMRIENLDWQNHVIFVPDSKTPEAEGSYQ